MKESARQKEIDVLLGEKLKYYRKEERITQERLAKRMTISGYVTATRLTVSRLEQGKQHFTADILLAIKNALDLSIDEFLG